MDNKFKRPQNLYRSYGAYIQFRNRITELGGTLLEPEWLGSMKPHHVRCVNGHECYPIPNKVQQGRGICRICAGNDTITAEKNYRSRLDAAGAIMLDTEWKGVRSLYKIKCAKGHIIFSNPNRVQQGQSICWFCEISYQSQTEFRNMLAKYGATLVEPYWQGSNKPHHVKCRYGHDCYPRPANVLSGQGICTKCVGKEWNVFYIVQSFNGNIKFGITSNDYRPRLARHSFDGYKKIIAIYENLPEGIAQQTERQCIIILRKNGIKPINGREYFPIDALTYIEQTVNKYLQSER